MQREKAMTAPSPRALPRLGRVNLADLILPCFILLLALVTGAIEPRFFSLSNMENLARQLVPLMIVSVGQAFAIISGGLDLSVAAVLSVASVTGILVMQEYGIAAGLIVMVAAGGIAGLASGAIIAYLRTSPLIITLGMMSIAQAIALILSHGVPIYDVPESLADSVGFGAIFGIPVTVIIGVGTLLMGWVILRKTVFGRYVYAIGSNQSAAIKSGVNVRFYTMLVYAVSGCCAGIAAIVMTAWVGAAQPVSAPTLSLESLAAVVLGGLALTGGSGSIKHVFYGVLILGMLSNAMNMMGISAFYQTLAVGIVIIVAVALDRLRRRQEH